MARDEYKQWRMAVFERDHFTCRDCGSKRGIEADHILPWVSHPSLRYDISNGRTLCRPCHQKTATYGWRAKWVIGNRRDGSPIFAIAGGADNKTIDNGGLTDFTAATDEIAGVDYQYVKLVDGTPDSTAKIQGTEANGLEVDVTRMAPLVAGTAFAGKVQLTDGTSDATVRNLAANDALNVAIVDGAGNQVTSFAGSGGTSSTDDADFTQASTAGTPVIGVFESAPTSVTDNDMGIIGIDVNRRVKVSVDASTLDVAHDAADSGNPVKTGAKAANTFPTAVANNDRTNNLSDLFGRQLVAHIDPAMAVHKNLTYTSQQTGTDVWTPAGGKRIAVTSVIIGSYGTTTGRVILWFGDNADTTFTQGTDQVIAAASFAPSSTSKPGLVYTPSTPVFCTTADREIHVTTDAAVSFDLTIEGYEF